MPPAEQRTIIDSLNKLNQGHHNTRLDNSDLAARIASYELAYKMQATAPEAIDVDSEPDHVKELYGLDDGRTEDFARKMILSRRLVERGVRFIQVYSGGNHNDANWDAHGDLEKNHNYHAGRTDKPIAGLLKDLKQRGLLDETLVVWGGEFGRQPTAEYAKGTGRDHNAYGFTMWMAGGGIKGGTSYGKTDELGGQAVENRLHVPQPARHRAPPARPRPEQPLLLLQRPRPETRRRRGRRSDLRHHGLIAGVPTSVPFDTGLAARRKLCEVQACPTKREIGPNGSA